MRTNKLSLKTLRLNPIHLRSPADPQLSINYGELQPYDDDDHDDDDNHDDDDDDDDDTDDDQTGNCPSGTLVHRTSMTQALCHHYCHIIVTALPENDAVTESSITNHHHPPEPPYTLRSILNLLPPDVEMLGFLAIPGNPLHCRPGRGLHDHQKL